MPALFVFSQLTPKEKDSYVILAYDIIFPKVKYRLNNEATSVVPGVGNPCAAIAQGKGNGCSLSWLTRRAQGRGRTEKQWFLHLELLE